MQQNSYTSSIRPDPLIRPRLPRLVIVRNGDGTSAVQTMVDDELVGEEIVTDEDADSLVRARRLGKGLSDCAWCRYGKPAVAGAVVGGLGAALLGYEATRGAVWGAVGGLAYGQVRG